MTLIVSSDWRVGICLPLLRWNEISRHVHSVFLSFITDNPAWYLRLWIYILLVKHPWMPLHFSLDLLQLLLTLEVVLLRPTADLCLEISLSFILSAKSRPNWASWIEKTYVFVETGCLKTCAASKCILSLIQNALRRMIHIHYHVNRSTWVFPLERSALGLLGPLLCN